MCLAPVDFRSAERNHSYGNIRPFRLWKNLTDGSLRVIQSSRTSWLIDRPCFVYIVTLPNWTWSLTLSVDVIVIWLLLPDFIRCGAEVAALDIFVWVEKLSQLMLKAMKSTKITIVLGVMVRLWFEERFNRSEDWKLVSSSNDSSASQMACKQSTDTAKCYKTCYEIKI